MHDPNAQQREISMSPPLPRLFLTVARCGSGQDTFARLVSSQFGIQHHTLSEELRRLAAERGVAATRENLQKIKGSLQRQYADAPVLAVLLAEKIKREQPKAAIVTGVRSIAEYNYFCSNFRVTLIAVTAPDDVRFLRMLKRGAERDPKSLGEIAEEDRREGRLHDYELLHKKADYTIDCSLPLAEFEKIAPALVQNIPEFYEP